MCIMYECILEVFPVDLSLSVYSILSMFILNDMHIIIIRN